MSQALRSVPRDAASQALKLRPPGRKLPWAEVPATDAAVRCGECAGLDGDPDPPADQDELAHRSRQVPLPKATKHPQTA